MPFAQFEPRPLVFLEKNIVISWSPKAACSHTLVWFFLKENLLYAANYYHPWPHNFRMDYYYRTHSFQRRWREVTESNGEGFTLIRVTRDPVKRFVSCFRHACLYDFLHDLVRRKVGTNPASDGLSVTDFYEALKGEQTSVPSSIDIHACAQSHPIWEANFDRVITHNLDETPLNQGLNEIEAELGFHVTNFEKFPKFDSIRKTHYAKDEPYTGSVPLENFRFISGQAAGFPKHQLENLPIVRKMAEEIHAADFGRVGKGDTSGILFTGP